MVTTPARAASTPGLAMRTIAASPPRSAVIVGHGEARTSPSEPWLAIDTEAQVPRGAEVRATSEPLRVRLPNGAEIQLSPGSALRISEPIDLVLVGRGRVTAARVALRTGELMLTTPHAPVLVEGPGEVLAVLLGGTARTRVLARQGDLPGGLAVASYRGDARVATRGAFRALGSDEVIELRSGRPIPAAKRLDVGPSWIREEGPGRAGPLAVVSATDATASLALRFSPVEGASGYELEIARNDTFANLVATSDVPAGAAEIETPELTVGRYFARMRSRNAGGLPGLPGPARALRVALAKLPSGATAFGGAFLLPRDRAVSWDDPAGLEISVGSIGFVHAAAQFGLLHAAPMPARVRLAGELSFVSLTLLPTPVHADIDLKPKRAAWPNDPVEVEVRLVGLQSPSSGDDPSAFQPTLRVAVNLDPVRVSWRREGDLLRATVPPSVTAGPWVVRVEATDPDNNPIGRGFLEVIQSR